MCTLQNIYGVEKIKFASNCQVHCSLKNINQVENLKDINSCFHSITFRRCLFHSYQFSQNTDWKLEISITELRINIEVYGTLLWNTPMHKPLLISWASSYSLKRRQKDHRSTPPERPFNHVFLLVLYMLYISL